MKAIRKLDGKTIYVEPVNYMGEATEWFKCEGCIYLPSELDFNVDSEPTVITIEREEYDELCRYRRYCANWAHGLVVCPHCGEFNPDGCICANCGKDRYHKN